MPNNKYLQCLSIGHPSGAAVHEFEFELDMWRACLPAAYTDSFNHDANQLLARQRYILTTYYLMYRMKVHLAFIQNSNPEAGYTPEKTRKQSRAVCVASAMDLVRLQCDSGEQALFEKNTWSFERQWSLFDAALTLVCVATDEDRPASECLIDRAIGVLSQDGPGTSGEIARIGSMVLKDLVRCRNEEFVSNPQVFDSTVIWAEHYPAM